MADDILLLNDFILTKMTIEWIPGTEESLPYNLGINYKVFQRKDNNKRFRLNFSLDISPESNNCGYKINTEIIGFFEFPEKFSQNQSEYLIRVNGGTILYGILRGEIANFTGSFPGGKFVLPTVSMREIVKNYEIFLRKEAEKSEPTKELT
jgi:hypothetical protein